MTDEWTGPMVPQVEYPFDYETDDQLRQVAHDAAAAKDLRAQIEAELDLAHRAMVHRDALLSELVSAVQAGDGDRTLHRAHLYAFWHEVFERRVQDARKASARGREREQEAER